jgi:hypothetical protein
MKTAVRILFVLLCTTPSFAADSTPASTDAQREAKIAQLKAEIERSEKAFDENMKLLQDGTDGLGSFAFNSIHLGMTLMEFLQRHPEAFESESRSEKENKIQSYLLAKLDHASCGEFIFYDGTLYQVLISYLPDRVKALGGYEVIAARMWTKYGTPDDCTENSQGTVQIWKRPAIGRRAELGLLANGMVGIRVADMEAESKVLEQRAKTAKTGF